MSMTCWRHAESCCQKRYPCTRASRRRLYYHYKGVADTGATTHSRVRVFKTHTKTKPLAMHMCQCLLEMVASLVLVGPAVLIHECVGLTMLLAPPTWWPKMAHTTRTQTTHECGQAGQGRTRQHASMKGVSQLLPFSSSVNILTAGLYHTGAQPAAVTAKEASHTTTRS
jgi:hypothetical protein